MKIMKQAQIFRIWASALVLLTAAGAWAAGPWYVATNGVDSNAGTSWDVPFLTISNALTNASTGGDTIWVSNGVYTLTATVSNPAAKKFNIRAWSTNPANTVLCGPGSNDVVNFRGVWMSGTGSLQGFTVTNFYLTNENRGAGVYCDAGLISNCVISGNLMGYNAGAVGSISASGGGVFLIGGGVIENCSIIGNRIHPADYDSGGGGVRIYNSGSQIRNCRIVGNIIGGALNGAGVYASSYAVIQDSVIASNIGGTAGGAITLAGGAISNCLVFANSAGSIGGIYVSGGASPPICRIEHCVVSNNSGVKYGGCSIYGTITNVLISQCSIVSNYCEKRATGGLGVENTVANIWIRNCLVAYNRADMGWGESGYDGCGMRVRATNALIENCTIVSNTLTGAKGAGLCVTNGARVVNSVIYHNSGVTASNVYASADCTFSNCCTAPLPSLGTANTDANPQFVAKDTGNFRLAARSPCINTGMYQDWMTGAVDLDGRKRIRYGTVDMGAYERIYEGSIYTVH